VSLTLQVISAFLHVLVYVYVRIHILIDGIDSGVVLKLFVLHILLLRFFTKQLLTRLGLCTRSDEAFEWALHPWIHSNCNSLSDSDQLRAVYIPDLHPGRYDSVHFVCQTIC